MITAMTPKTTPIMLRDDRSRLARSDRMEIFK
jgi:hypothetical protein